MSEPCNCDYYGNTNCRVHNENHPSIVIPALKAKLQAAQNPDFKALLAENERLCELNNAIEAKLLAAEAEALRQGDLAEEWAGKARALEVRAEKAEARAVKAEGVVKAAVAYKDAIEAKRVLTARFRDMDIWPEAIANDFQQAQKTKHETGEALFQALKALKGES